MLMLLFLVGLAVSYENPRRSDGPSKISLIDQLLKEIENDSRQFERLKSSGFLEQGDTVGQPK